MAKLQKFQTMMIPQGWATPITKAIHIDTLVNQSGGQQKVSDFMVRVLERNWRGSTESFISRNTKYFADDEEYYWDIYGSARRNISLVEARKIDGTLITAASGMIGANRERFKLIFDEYYFFKGEVILGALNHVYPIRLVDAPVNRGTQYEYEAELMTDNLNGIPAERLLAGEKFSYAYAPVERGLSKHVGGVRHTTPMKARNEFSFIRLSDEASGDIYKKKLAVGVPTVKRDANGKQVKSVDNMWMPYYMYEFELTWADYKDAVYNYSRSNRQDNGEYLNYGVSGEVIKQGDGLYAFLDRGNVFYMNKFSLPYLESIFGYLSSSKLELNQRHFMIRTGEAGARDFNNAVRNAMSGWTEFVYNGDALGVVKKTSSALHEVSLQAGGQFTKYLGPNNMIFEVVVDKRYDDPVANKLVLADGTLASSHRMDVFDIGTTNGEPNMFRCAIEGEPTDARSYAWGPRNPYTGEWGNPHMSFPDDKAQITVMGHFGLCIPDVTRVASIIPNALAA